MIDNNSTDGSAEIVKQYPEIKLFSESKEGSYAARNRGIIESKGKIIAFTDADCLAQDDWLQNILTAMQLPDVNIIQGNIRFINGSLALSMLESYQAEKADFIFSGNKKETYYGSANNMAVRKESFDQLGLFSEIKRGADVIFVHRVIDKYSIEAVRYSCDVRVVHLEIENLRQYYLKNYLYGKSCGNYSKIAPSKPLNNEERLKIFKNTISRKRYPITRSALLFILLCLGGVFYEVGRIRENKRKITRAPA